MTEQAEVGDIRIFNSRYELLELSLDKYEAVELDLGCGKGSFSTALAKKFPQRLILGADVMIGRLKKLQKRNERENVNNMLLLRSEAKNLLGYMIGDGVLKRIHLLCPDPWPKGRHRGNRLLCSDFVIKIHRVLAENGEFHFSSDDEYYHNAVRRVIELSNLFDPVAPDADLNAIKSDFELRWNEQGKAVHHLWYRKRKLVHPGIGH